MSRAYRIEIAESLRRKVRVDDTVTAAVELPAILPNERMAELLGLALAARGFTVADGVATRSDELTWRIELGTGAVHLGLSDEGLLELHAERGAEVGDQTRAARAAELRARVRQDLDEQADAATAGLRREVTRRLEDALAGARQELDGAVTAAIGAALKERAAQLGQITEVFEDPQTGSLLIKVRV